MSDVVSLSVGNGLQLHHQNAVYRVPAHLPWSKSDRRICCHLLHERRCQVFSQWWSWNRCLSLSNLFFFNI